MASESASPASPPAAGLATAQIRPGRFCILDSYSILKLSGVDAAGFLQGQATCDVKSLGPGETRLGAFCNPKGRVIAQFRLVRHADHFYLILPQELAEGIRKRLQMYVLRSKVLIENLAASWTVLGLLGGSGAESAVLGTGSNEARPDHQLVDLKDGTGRRLVIATVDAAAEIRNSLMADAGCDPAETSAWRLEDIRAGIPQVVAATSETFLPQMLNLDRLGGIGFKKGCYTGQEIVARTQYLGQLKRRMFRISVPGTDAPPPGTHFYRGFTGNGDGQSVGQVVIGEKAADDTIELLAVIVLEHAGSGDLRIGGSADFPASLLPLPYTFEEQTVPES